EFSPKESGQESARLPGGTFGSSVWNDRVNGGWKKPGDFKVKEKERQGHSPLWYYSFFLKN
ncbi:MAG: hypothetical protein IJJ20_02470, partial [Thermoguttaceae bacterium]|nr:hypothetical protein [Thermoguttaceae bacterium]